MTTQEVANKLVRLCREGKYEEAHELYADDAVHAEMPGFPNQITEGKENILKAYHSWQENVEETHGSTVGDPIVAGNHFAVTMTLDITFKGKGRQQVEEICNYQVDNGEIKKVSFFYDTSGGA